MSKQRVKNARRRHRKVADLGPVASAILDEVTTMTDDIEQLGTRPGGAKQSGVARHVLTARVELPVPKAQMMRINAPDMCVASWEHLTRFQPEGGARAEPNLRQARSSEGHG